MHWPWSKRPVKHLPVIPPYCPPVRGAMKREEGIVVDEHDTSNLADEDLAALRIAQSQTGKHRAWKRLTRQQ